jgi:hypothetical protein
MKSVIRELSCTLLPGKYPDGKPVPQLYNEVYQYWKKTWQEIFTRAGSPDSLNAENFLRQDVIVVLHRGNEIAGIETSSFFNLSAEPTFDHGYLRPVPAEFMEKLRSIGAGILTTGEYLSVQPEFRRSEVGVPLSEVLIGLCKKVFRESHARIMLGTAVKSARVHESVKRFGSVEVGSFQKYGLDCLLFYNDSKNMHDHDDPEVAALVDHFWMRKKDLTGLMSDEDMSRVALVKAA